MARIVVSEFLGELFLDLLRKRHDVVYDPDDGLPRALPERAIHRVVCDSCSVPYPAAASLAGLIGTPSRPDAAPEPIGAPSALAEAPAQLRARCKETDQATAGLIGTP